ncbi:MAG TPA: hypothetical protein VM364_21790 [Vicinamibacterales bacterium]|nr:hypothetical protein [Vicinamibacterales bacterium]
MSFGRAALVALWLCSAALAAPSRLHAADHPERDPLGTRLRGATTEMNVLIELGIRRSHTFARLVDALRGTDVVVYLSAAKSLPRGIDGRLAFMTTAGGVRYLHAQVLDGLALDDTIAIVAHELQHALEVAAHPEVRTAVQLGALYERIGERSLPNRFDTAAARLTGRRVRQELGSQ